MNQSQTHIPPPQSLGRPPRPRTTVTDIRVPAGAKVLTHSRPPARFPITSHRVVNLRDMLAIPRPPMVRFPLELEALAARAGKLEQPSASAPTSFGRRMGGWVLTFAMMAGIVVGVPKALAWGLKTPFPMAAITSGSMWPQLKIGDLVFIQGIPPSEVKKGDIIVFRNATNDSLTIHRVVDLGSDKLTTKGDANFENDVPVPYSAIVGRAVTVFGEKPLKMPYLGSVTVFASNLRAHE